MIWKILDCKVCVLFMHCTDPVHESKWMQERALKSVNDLSTGTLKVKEFVKFRTFKSCMGVRSKCIDQVLSNITHVVS